MLQNIYSKGAIKVDINLLCSMQEEMHYKCVPDSVFFFSRGFTRQKKMMTVYKCVVTFCIAKVLSYRYNLPIRPVLFISIFYEINR